MTVQKRPPACFAFTAKRRLHRCGTGKMIGEEIIVRGEKRAGTMRGLHMVTARVCKRDDHFEGRVRHTCCGEPKNDSRIQGRRRQNALRSSHLILCRIHPSIATSVGVAVNILLLRNSMPEIAIHCQRAPNTQVNSCVAKVPFQTMAISELRPLLRPYSWTYHIDTLHIARTQLL
jgi:hypothetical protein